MESRVAGTVLVATACGHCGHEFYTQTSDEFGMTGRPLMVECRECGFIGPPSVTERWASPTTESGEEK